jgi:hypothetical protein
VPAFLDINGTTFCRSGRDDLARSTKPLSGRTRRPHQINANALGSALKYWGTDDGILERVRIASFALFVVSPSSNSNATGLLPMSVRGLFSSDTE